jgi:serine/threonine-protein kinase HipA
MTKICTIQLFCSGAWTDVATVSLFGDERAGWRAKKYSGYSVEWAFSHGGARDAHALSCQAPVGLEPLELPHWPVFLIDVLPQGFGREELLRRIGLPAMAGQEADWRLLKAGAGNTIGNLRIKEAAEWLHANTGPTRGFTDDEVALRSGDFAEYLASHGLFVAGSSGVQGEWPKVLLTRADDGLLYLDHTLSDERAREHYIVKFGRGTNERLASILRHEAPYMGLAKRLGLRVHAPLVLKERALFIRRFDRAVTAQGVHRLAQESIATLTGMPGIDSVPSHDRVCGALIARCTDPQTEVLEYLKRDVANLALGNKDNHARNTALQRDFKGDVRLTPLYDFAPMYLHPDGIARRIRWNGNDDGSPDWTRVLDRVRELDSEDDKLGRRKRQKRPANLGREFLVEGLKGMAPALQEIALNGEAMGLDHDVLQYLRPGIIAQVQRLSELK